MSSGSANNSITIDEKIPNWYSQTIFREALSSIPEYFKKIPPFETLNFRHCKSFGPTVLANWPQEASPIGVELGIYDNTYSDRKGPVYALVHRPKMNLVAYFLIQPDLSIYRITQHRLQNVEFSEPFCDLGDRTVGSQTVCNRIRAVVLHYFLAAGHVKEIVNYRDFWMDFTKSCAWIANEGNPPKLQTGIQREESRPALDAPLVLDTKPVVSALDTITPKKRPGDDDSQVAPVKTKRRDYSHAMQEAPIITPGSSSPEYSTMEASVMARLTASEKANDLLRAEIATQTRSLDLYQTRIAANNQLQARVTGLTDELSRVKHDAMYSQNAYRGIQVQYDDLRVQHVNALNHGKGLHEQLRQSQSRCSKAEERSRVLETELVQLKRKMKEARKALDDGSH